MDVWYFRILFQVTSFGTIPKHSGGMARGMFFEMLKAHDKHAATEIHDEPGIKSFALSNLMVMKSNGHQRKMDRRRKSRDIELLEGTLVYFDVATVNEQLAKLVPISFNRSWKADHDGLELKALELTQVNPSTVMSKELPNPIPVRFHTPTSFTMGSQYIVWPEPSLVFSNLVSIWNVWYPKTTWDREHVDGLLKKIHVESADGRISRATTGKKKVHRGWVGMVWYRCEDEETHRFASSLLKIGFMTGVGRGRTAGLGRFSIPNVLTMQNVVEKYALI